jgi:hypothetical protein
VAEPDFYVEHLPTNPWIHQPFEEYDHLRPSDLKAGGRSERRLAGTTDAGKGRPASRGLS